MSYLDAEDAVNRAIAREDEVRAVGTAMDDALMLMCNIFNLPADTAQWSGTLASRLEDQNLCHTEDVVYLLRLNSHDLRMFHARPPRKKLGSLHSPVTVEEESETVCGTHPDHEGSGSKTIPCATTKLVSLMTQAMKSTIEAKSLQAELDRLERGLRASPALAATDIVLIRSNKPTASCIEKLHSNVAQASATFRRYKDCFYLLSDEGELEKCIKNVRARAIPARAWIRDVKPQIEILRRLEIQREATMSKASMIGEDLAITWFSSPEGRVRRAVYDKEVAKFRPLLSRIRKQEKEQTEALLKLKELHQLALAGEETVPVASDGTKEVTLLTLVTAFETYGQLTDCCREIIEASQPIIRTLREYIDMLRLTSGVHL
ncbi:hypothetical protein C8Q76DRAFT_792250 [Earliella scabrosa]|nr:hypothetical protein C8Q76DRAFT_792250 [Earliella scabrosa]